MDIRRHGRFLIAIAAGVAVFIASAPLGPWELGFLVAGSLFFLVYLVLTARFLARATAEHLRRRAAAADEGLPLILLVTAGAVLLSFIAIYLLLAEPGPMQHEAALVAVASIPLGWLTLHTLASFHYANLFYAPRDGRDSGGLDFPGTAEPGPWDFLYFAFVIGMTAQVSDVAVRTPVLRRTVLAHGVASFFYNTVILAFAVNAAVAIASG
ncbi:MAG: DUF1345 domain-containing protein [Amaricoccus sp.]